MIMGVVVGLTFLPTSVRRQPLLTGVIAAWGLAQLVLGAQLQF